MIFSSLLTIFQKEINLFYVNFKDFFLYEFILTNIIFKINKCLMTYEQVHTYIHLNIIK